MTLGRHAAGFLFEHFQDVHGTFLRNFKNKQLVSVSGTHLVK